MVKAKSSFPWKKLRIAIQITAFIGWLFLWIKITGFSWPVVWSRLPVELDPLLASALFISGRLVLSGFLFCLIVLGLTLILGRAWCGWLCPVGMVLDVFPIKRKAGEKRPVPEKYRKGKFLFLVLILVAAVFGNLSLILFDPITLWIRTMTTGIAPILNTAFSAMEKFLANFSILDNALQRLDQWMRPAIFPSQVIGTRLVWFPVLIFGGIVLLNILAERFWCRYICPLGGLLGLFSRFALIRRQVKPQCKLCGKCSSGCPTGTIDPAHGYASDPAECIDCMNCLSACTCGMNNFRLSNPHPEKHAYDANRRDFLITGAVTLAGLAVLEADRNSDRIPSNVLRPPGVEPDEFLRRCLRCGLCVRACPTGALQPAVMETGLQGLFTPVLVPRLGYCQFSCNQCGQVCPSGAIPPLPLEEKQLQVIGKALIDRNRCLPWADGVSCIVCEEMCPLQKKAIILEVKQILLDDGSIQELKLPWVQRDLCTGCGICENKCPKSGEAAIRVNRMDFV